MATTAASAAPDGARALPSWGRHPAHASGPRVARLFHRVLGAVSLCAWASLASQLPVLVGSRGLLPASEFFAGARDAGLGFGHEPSLLWFWHGDRALALLAGCGCALATLALLGLWPRTCFALSSALYLSFATVCDEFTAFQWDNMLVETALLAAFLPGDRPAPLVHFAFRALLFKLYFESGIAKWQSHLHDWHDGSAMSFYYETAPIPAALAWFMHQLPAAYHKLESWGALVLELAVPLLVWGPRPSRLCAFAAFTGFQLLNTATANYGFFTYLSLALHVFLLSDSDVARASTALRSLWPRAWPALGVFRDTGTLRLPAFLRFELGAAPARAAARALRVTGIAGLGAWLLASALAGWLSFARGSAPPRALTDLYVRVAPWRVANAYHLFGHITRERIEPQFETLARGQWREHDFWYKPGSMQRPPPYVAPHQPRVDFRLWFYGLSFRRGLPRYVYTLLQRLCHDPDAVAALFTRPLPDAAEAVRIRLYRYRFTNADERAHTGAWWQRELLFTTPARSCR